MKTLTIIMAGSLLLALAAAAMAAMPSKATQPKDPTDPFENAPATNVRRPDKVFVYKNTPQGDLRMHMYLPTDWKPSDKRPVIVFFHGGGWSAGKPDQLFSRAEYFASRGLVTISVEYRVLKPHGTTPEKSFMDSRSAMRYVRKNAATLGIDPDKIIASGSSAGGVLACAMAVQSGMDEPGEDTSVSYRPQAAIIFGNCPDTSGKASRWRGTPEEAKGKQYSMEMSPSHHIAPGCPPMIQFSGSKDVYVKQCLIAFTEKMLAAGNRIELYIAPGQPHGFHGEAPWLQAVTIKTDEFLTSLGYLSGPPTWKPTDLKAQLIKLLPRDPSATSQPTIDEISGN